MTNKIYITMQGDAWDAIAYRLWENECLFEELIKANPAYLGTVVFPAGIKLQVPKKPAARTSQELPPWRK